MKLSEVIKVIGDKAELVFKNDGYTARFDKHLECVMIDLCGVATTVFPLDGWEEVKPPRQWGEKEQLAFKMFPWAKWFAREHNGDILLSETKPKYVRDEDGFSSYWFIDEEEPRFVTISTTKENELTTVTFE